MFGRRWRSMHYRTQHLNSFSSIKQARTVNDYFQSPSLSLYSSLSHCSLSKLRLSLTCASVLSSSSSSSSSCCSCCCCCSFVQQCLYFCTCIVLCCVLL